MDANEKRIREERAATYDGMVAIMEACKTGNRGTTVEEAADFDARETRLTELDADLARVVSVSERAKGIEEVAETRGASVDESVNFDKRHAAAFHSYLQGGMAAVASEDRALMFGQRTTLDANAISTNPNTTAYSAGATGYDGGYMVPQGFWDNLQIALKAFGGISSYFNLVETSTGAPMPWPTTDPTAIVGSYITTEGTQLGFTDIQFGQGMLNAWTITSNVFLASVQIINDSAFDVDAFVTDRIGEAIGRKVAAECQTGTGSSALLGINTALVARGVVAGASGGVYLSGTAVKSSATAAGNVSTLQVPSGTAKLAAGLMGFDDVLGMIAKIDPAYRASGRCTWVMNDHDLQALRTVTDAYGHPLWQPNVQTTAPDMIGGYPVAIDNNSVSISTTASTVGGPIFGDLKSAMVMRRVNQAGVMRLTERYADYLQVGFLGFLRYDLRSNDLRAAVQYSTNAT